MCHSDQGNDRGTVRNMDPLSGSQGWTDSGRFSPAHCPLSRYNSYVAGPAISLSPLLTLTGETLQLLRFSQDLPEMFSSFDFK